MSQMETLQLQICIKLVHRYLWLLKSLIPLSVINQLLIYGEKKIHSF